MSEPFRKLCRRLASGHAPGAASVGGQLRSTYPAPTESLRSAWDLSAVTTRAHNESVAQAPPGVRVQGAGVGLRSSDVGVDGRDGPGLAELAEHRAVAVGGDGEVLDEGVEGLGHRAVPVEEVQDLVEEEQDRGAGRLEDAADRVGAGGRGLRGGA